MTQDLIRPELTMPEAEAARLRDAYAEAEVILEYGSGGSTVIAAEMSGKSITSVESDAAWVRMMGKWFKQNPPAGGSTVDMVHVDVGDTGDWGYPQTEAKWRNFARYPLRVWKRLGATHPDVVLVDGRFRIGCALATAFNITRPVTLLFDDYLKRRAMSQVESFIGAPVHMIGRMAEFRVTPTEIPADKLLDIMRFMTRP